jgi:hypothetical protein
MYQILGLIANFMPLGNSISGYGSAAAASTVYGVMNQVLTTSAFSFFFLRLGNDTRILVSILCL